MKQLDVRELHASALARVADVACAAPRSPRGGREWSAEPELIVPRRGVFAVHRRDGVIVADAATAVLLGAEEEYRVSHPSGHGDACTVLAFAPDARRSARARARRAAATGDTAPRRVVHRCAAPRLGSISSSSETRPSKRNGMPCRNEILLLVRHPLTGLSSKTVPFCSWSSA